VSAGGWTSVSLPAGSYNTALAASGSIALSPDGPVTVLTGQTIGCTYTMAAAPVCGGTGVVVVDASELTGSFLTGFCIAPANPVAGSVLCSDSSSLTGLNAVAAGTSVSISLPALHYNAALADDAGPTLGPFGAVDVRAGRTTFCAFTLAATPLCVFDDGVLEPSGVDRNGDGVFDDQQASVATFTPAVGGGLLTIAAPDSTYAITGVTNTGPPYTPAPPAGASLPVGVLGFSVALPAGTTTADVQVILPTGSSPTSYFKLHGGTWLDYTSHASIVGDTVTLHLVDGDAFDADGTVNGVIVDPGFPSTGHGYGFTGFAAPIDNVNANTAKAGQTIALKWRLTDAAGAPVSDPASVTSITSQLCKGGDESKALAPGQSGLQYLGKGNWQFNWKTDKAFKNQCRTLTLTLNDGTVHVATFLFN
jgi:hypothetical protein